VDFTAQYGRSPTGHVHRHFMACTRGSWTLLICESQQDGLSCVITKLEHHKLEKPKCKERGT
jgi:hypothetical protein